MGRWEQKGNSEQEAVTILRYLTTQGVNLWFFKMRPTAVKN
jgi:hypothetical protein